MVSILLPDPAALGSIPSIPEIISDEKCVNIAKVHQQCCLDESGQWRENVDQTHLVMASGNLKLRKSYWTNGYKWEECFWFLICTKLT